MPGSTARVYLAHFADGAAAGVNPLAHCSSAGRRAAIRRGAAAADQRAAHRRHPIIRHLLDGALADPRVSSDRAGSACAEEFDKIPDIERRALKDAFGDRVTIAVIPNARHAPLPSSRPRRWRRLPGA
jgi:hypothetical protein